VIVLEKEGAVGSHQTGHNSGVIHTGVYYKPGSLKARLCVEGARAMLAYCRERSLPVAVPGKVIVATRTAELPRLEEVFRRGQANGVEGLRWLEADGLQAIEPNIAGIAAIHAPTAAIADYAAVARSYADDICAAGGEVHTGSKVVALRDGNTAVVEANTGSYTALRVVNCAGLLADRVMALAGHGDSSFQILPFRGEYYDLAPRAAGLLHGLVYPVPDPRFPFLGVHFTPRVHGGVEAGPSAVLAWQREGYGRFAFSVADAGAMLGFPGFWAMTARYWQKGLGEQYRSLARSAYIRALRVLLPELRDGDVQPGGTGVRAQVVLRNGKLMDDFCIRQHGRFTHVINVPSPAATASLMIGREIASMI
jgi:(S)-2-hydroxyglutarate dehydrogenase